eukprot:gb/GFBE01064271.1/.p1 GENE.gb/GFBE01064271.1/~~gb/GFBE01064271.1/.p1  ORF type:complete len:275 (+),score=68.59 gb/GFBE01064271.1/:1-825(+)
MAGLVVQPCLRPAATAARLSERSSALLIAAVRSAPLPASLANGHRARSWQAHAAVAAFAAATLVQRSRRGSARRAESEAAEATDAAVAAEEGGEDQEQAPEAKPRKRRQAFDPASQPGAGAPLGYFDPLGFCPLGDEGKFRELRCAEIKHGRVAMMASVGLLAQCFIRIPAFGLKEAPSGIQAATIIPSSWGFTLVVFAAMVVELLFWVQDSKKEPGNFGDPLGLKMYDLDMRNKEINNGRFAMFAALGIVAAELVTGKDAIEQFGLSVQSGLP